MLEVIDLGGLATGDTAAVQRVAAALGRACRDVGFFYIRNHGVPEALISDMFAASRAFFAAPKAAKDELAISRSRHNRGYVGIATESLNLVHADLKEAFNIGLDLSPVDPEVVAGKPFRGVNLWPDTPGFRDTALAYFNALWRLGLDLHLAIATDLGLPASYFADKFDRPMATLRLLHYPPRAARSRRTAGRRRAYRLRQPDHSAHRRCRRPRSAAPRRRLDQGAADTGHLRLQHRRLPDALEQRHLCLDAAPRDQPAGTRPLLHRVFLRSQPGGADRMLAWL